MYRVLGVRPLFTSTLALFILLAGARAAEPIVRLSRFHNMPTRLFSFDDTSTLVYHDQSQGTTYVSEDEGSSWAVANDLPRGEIEMVIPHPVNHRIAFALTDSIEHWRTEDRGKSWRPFDVPHPPAWVASPLAFHSDRDKDGYVLYQSRVCKHDIGRWGSICHDETYYVKEAFSDKPKKLLSNTQQCMFAHSSAAFVHDAHPDLIYCVAFDASSSSGAHTLSASRLYSSTDFFEAEVKLEDLGIGKNARGVVLLAIVSKFAVVALRDTEPGSSGNMQLYVSADAKKRARANFPPMSRACLRDNACVIVEGMAQSLGVDVLLHSHSAIGTLLVSDSAGTRFVESLAHTNRKNDWRVDSQQVPGIEGVRITNVVTNAPEIEARRAAKRLASRITFDDGHTWAPLRAPSTDAEGMTIGCDNSDPDACSLHLHSVTVPHHLERVVSSPAPGYVMGVGSVGTALRPYAECDTFLSADAGVSWSMVRRYAHISAFGDQGSIVVAAKDANGVINAVHYSVNLGTTWQQLQLGVSMRARALVKIPNTTSQKFVLLGQLAREDKDQNGGYAAIFLDFTPVRIRQCGASDIEKWYVRTATDRKYVLGHRQCYWRRKPDADCYIGKKLGDPEEHEENCPCANDDYECDFNYVLKGGKCVQIDPEPIKSGECTTGAADETYLGSSGYRLIPGNTCDRAKESNKDEPIRKPCSQAEAPESKIQHQEFKFSAAIVQQQYFNNSYTLILLLQDHTAWQTSNEGYTWMQLGDAEDRFVAIYIHPYADDRAYLVTAGDRYLYTANTGRQWQYQRAPTRANTFGLPHLSFHPTQLDMPIWTGEVGCDSFGSECYVSAAWSYNGRAWAPLERYVRRCEWARDAELAADPTLVICESYTEKVGDQRTFGAGASLALVAGSRYFRNRREVFGHVAGFTKFPQFLVVAEVLPERGLLDLQVSLDGKTFAAGMFPQDMKLDTHSFTILESSTDSLFVYKTTSETQGVFWGSILKSNSNGTYFSLSADLVNRDMHGFVDLEKMIGLDGISLINVVANPTEAVLTGRKELRTKITHNDGGSWAYLTPPEIDSTGQKYECAARECALHVHGYSGRSGQHAKYSTPSVPGLFMAVGNVGTSLKPYTESDTFISRDAGFTWEEVHKGAHLWGFGDSGSVLVIANDEAPTDHVLFSMTEGAQWREYKFSDKKVRVRAIVTVPQDMSRKFLLLVESARGMSVAVQIDFSSVTRKICVYNEDRPNDDDFELWSPSAQREECLFGREVWYLRRKREANCKVGDQLAMKEVQDERICRCTYSDFECEYNHVRNPQTGGCELIPGETPLPADPDTSCHAGEDSWYERTAYRKIAHSRCEGGVRPDRGIAHTCPALSRHEGRTTTLYFMWLLVLAGPFAAAAGVATWVRRARRTAIRLPTSADGGAPMRW